MGTTRIKVIDLSAEAQEIKTSRKHAEKLTGVAKLKKKKASKVSEVPNVSEEKGITKATESVSLEEHLRGEIEATSGKHPGREKKVEKTAESPVARRHHQGRKYQQAAKLIDKSKSYAISEALDLLSKTSTTKFDPTVEVHLNVADKNLQATVKFPHPVGHRKEPRYLIFSDSPSVPSKPSRSIERGSPSATAPSVIWASEQTIADIQSGKLKPKRDFDVVIAQPKFMPQLAKIAKILGPAGLMPNPKNGTISQDPQKAISQKDDGAVNLALDPTAPILHTVIGKLSAKPQHLSQNLQALILAVGSTKIKKATITTTMSPGIKVDLTALN